MHPAARRFVGLCLPPLVFCASDGSVTLLGQSDVYWSGNYAHVNEASPTFNHLLQIHPAAFAAGLCVWAMMFVVMILLLPELLALIISIGVTFAHAAGTATWLLWRFQFGYQACNGLFLAASILLGLGIHSGWKARPEQAYRFRGWSAWTRLLLAGTLFATGVYLFLWPRRP